MKHPYFLRLLPLFALSLLLFNGFAFSQSQFPLKETALHQTYRISDSVRFEVYAYRVYDTIIDYEKGGEKWQHKNMVSAGYELVKKTEAPKRLVIDTLGFPTKFNPGYNRINEFELRFLNDSVIVIVGIHERIYVRNFPYLGKSTDGGRTWERLAYEEENQTQLENNCHFWDENRSIYITDMDRFVSYALTDDGWKTWKSYSGVLQVKNGKPFLSQLKEEKKGMTEEGKFRRIQELNDGEISHLLYCRPVVYTEDGNINISLCNVSEDSKKVVYNLVSKDFGKTFELVKE